MYLYQKQTSSSKNTKLPTKFKDLCVVTVYTSLKIYLHKKHCLFLSTIVHSLACFIMGLLNMLQKHGFVYT